TGQDALRPPDPQRRSGGSGRPRALPGFRRLCLHHRCRVRRRRRAEYRCEEGDSMTLDPQARLIVEALTAMFPDLGGTVTDGVEARELLARAPQLPILVQLPSVADRTVPGLGGAHEIPVRVYRPVADQDAVTPVVVFFHGGGFTICNVEIYDNFCRQLAHA